MIHFKGLEEVSEWVGERPLVTELDTLESGESEKDSDGLDDRERDGEVEEDDDLPCDMLPREQLTDNDSDGDVENEADGVSGAATDGVSERLGSLVQVGEGVDVRLDVGVTEGDTVTEGLTDDVTDDRVGEDDPVTEGSFVADSDLVALKDCDGDWDLDELRELVAVNPCAS